MIMEINSYIPRPEQREAMNSCISVDLLYPPQKPSNSKLHPLPSLSPSHNPHSPSNNFHTLLLIFYSSLATVLFGNCIFLLFKLLSAGRLKDTLAMSACSCLEGRVKMRKKVRWQVGQVGLGLLMWLKGGEIGGTLWVLLWEEGGW